MGIRPSRNVPKSAGRAKLAPCPRSPNCVSSDATETRCRVEPLLLKAAAANTWQTIADIVAAMPRTRVVERREGYLRAECRSAIVGFVDDLELELRIEQLRVAVRSASRLGYYDFGVNRRRIERLRSLLRFHGLSS
jgi:uncharacterized protein (DUF1499 family)